MSIFEAIVNHFNQHIDASSRSIESITPYLAEAANLLSQTLTNEHKILCVTSSHSASAGQQFCHNMLASATIERPALPAILIQSNGATEAQQVQALGQENDLLFILSSSGDEEHLSHCIDNALNRNMNIISIACGEASLISARTPKDQVHIALPGLPMHQSISLQFLIIQILSDLTEQQLFGNISS